MRLTIGMAVYDDFHGEYFTIQALRMFHVIPDNLDVEFIVVDNNSGSNEGKMGRDFVTNWVKPSKYIDMPEPKGTTQTRQRIFDEATGDVVMVMDPHVLLWPGSIKRLMDFYSSPGLGQEPHLFSGPMLYDNLESKSTEFKNVWREQMWGIWECDERGTNPENPPYEIWAQGLGCFTCRKDAWLGFNPHFRGFGGEEGYIHEKFRKAGRKAYCLPWLMWGHRFGRPAGVPYPLTLWNKVRNYVLGHQELGLPLDEVHSHFVKSNMFSQQDWNTLTKDAIGMTVPQTQGSSGCGSCGSGQPQPPENLTTLDTIYEWIKQRPRDIDQHLPKLKRLASMCTHVTEFGTRRESTVGLLAGKPNKFISHNMEGDKIYDRLHDAVKTEPNKKISFTTHIGGVQGDSLTCGVIEETDLLFLDTLHNAERLCVELKMHAKQVRRFIVVHDTHIYGEVGDNKQAGLLGCLRFFVKENPEWSVVYHTHKQYGLTVLSKDPQDKKKLPSLPKMAWNYTKAWTAHKAAGEPMAEEPLIQLRLDTCSLCVMRTENRCAQCGCFLDVDPKEQPGKATWKDTECPLGYWSASEKQGTPVMPLAETE